MTGFSDAVTDVVRRFAKDMGLDPAPAEDGSYTFSFSHWGELSLTSSADGEQVLVSLARTPARTDAESGLRLLAQAGYDPTTSSFLHAGLAPDGSHVCVTVIRPRDFDLVTLDAALIRLANALDTSIGGM